MPEPTDPAAAPASGGFVHQNTPSYNGPPLTSMGIPPWALGILSIVGVGVGGGGMGFLGGSQATKDIEVLTEKVDKLDEKMSELREAIIRVHPALP